MGKVRDHGSVHLEVDLDGRTAQFGMRRGAGVGSGQPSEPGDIAGQFDDPLVVDVVQHKIEASGRLVRSPLAAALHGPIYGRKWRKYSPAASPSRAEMAAHS